MTASRLSLGEVSPSTLSARGRTGKYVPADPGRLIAEALGKPYSVAAQLLKLSDSRCPFGPAAELTAILWQGGRGDVATRLRLPIDLAQHAGPVQSLDDLLVEETVAEGAENEASCVFTIDRTPIAWSTLRRRLVREIEVSELLIAAGDQKHGRTP